MRLRAPTTLLLVLAAGLAGGCGADDEGEPLPQHTASDLLAQLQSIQDRFDFPGGQACADITGGSDPNTSKVAQLIDSLPDDVDPDLRDAVRQSFDRLFELVDQECSEQPTQTDTETDTTETEAPPDTETDTTDTETTETDTTDTTTTDTLPPSDTDQTVPTDDGGSGGGATGPEGDE
jgi:hypothetical protein